MKKRFSFPGLLLSLLGGALGFCSGALLEMLLRKICNYSTEPVIIIIVSGFALMMAVLFGFIGLRLGLALQKRRFLPAKPGIAMLIIALIFTFAVGSGGQWLYCLEERTFQETIQVPGSLAGANVALLLDESGSMYAYEATCKEAACSFVDCLTDNYNLQFAAFAYDVQTRNVSQFLPMNAGNKQIMKDFINNTYDSGGTDFDKVLSVAVNTLQSNASADRKSVIIMITDGIDNIEDAAVLQALQSDEFLFFSIRITNDDTNSSPDVQNLLNLVDEDFIIGSDASGKLDVAAIKAAFDKALAINSTETREYQKTVLTNEALWQRHEFTTTRFLVEMAVCVLLSVMTSLAYCGKLNVVELLVDLVLGAICGALVSFVPLAGFIGVWVLCLGGFVILREVPSDV